jgi:hypothetical protein
MDVVPSRLKMAGGTSTVASEHRTLTIDHRMTGLAEEQTQPRMAPDGALRMNRDASVPAVVFAGRA